MQENNNQTNPFDVVKQGEDIVKDVQNIVNNVKDINNLSLEDVKNIIATGKDLVSDVKQITISTQTLFNGAKEFIVTHFDKEHRLKFKHDVIDFIHKKLF
jgi:hemin uptake protein HemP